MEKTKFKNQKKTFMLLLVFVTFMGSSHLFAENNLKPPNIILLFADDLGYGDLSCFGSVWNQTPEIDRMATEGLRFTDFSAGAPVCTPSRAGLMTGSYARRVDLDMDATNRWVLFPGASKGINPNETILPEVLKKAGYATAVIGKWHLGDQPEFLPLNHGFDYYYGIPYSNDMGISSGEKAMLPIIQNNEVIQFIDQGSREDQSVLTKRYTLETIEWINKNKEQPFFLYLAYTMPHVPVAATEQFQTRTNNPNPQYGASIAEISWSTGKILDYLREEDLAKNTLVIFTSDNGGAPILGSSNGILRESKGQIFEGGIRVPCIAWWPGKIAPGSTCHSFASVIDLYHTFSSLANYQVNDNVKRDGKDITDYLFHPGINRDPRPFFYWHAGYLMAVRFGKWKLNLLGQFSNEEKKIIMENTYNLTQFPDDIELYNLVRDPEEMDDVSENNPEMVKRLMKMAEKQRKKLGEYTIKGPEVRKTLSVESPEFLIK